MKKIIRLGTRGSPLALLQAEEARKKLLANYPELATEADIEIITIRTSGDWRPEQKDQSFIDLGGNKGLFTKEIEEALLTKYIDLAVHSMKDVANILPDRLEIAAFLERVDPRDAFIGRQVKKFGDLPKGATVGTCSLRRQAQILAQRPDLKIISLRGNVETRLKKLESGTADATILAVAGLTRLGLEKRISSILETDIMLPSVAQGAIGIEIRRDDEAIKKLLTPLNHTKTSQCVTAERVVMQILDGSCKTPLAAYAQFINDNEIMLQALAAKADGTSVVKLNQKGPANKAENLGKELGQKLKSQLPSDFFAA